MYSFSITWSHIYIECRWILCETVPRLNTRCPKRTRTIWNCFVCDVVCFVVGLADFLDLFVVFLSSFFAKFFFFGCFFCSICFSIASNEISGWNFFFDDKPSQTHDVLRRSERTVIHSIWNWIWTVMTRTNCVIDCQHVDIYFTFKKIETCQIAAFRLLWNCLNRPSARDSTANKIIYSMLYISHYARMKRFQSGQIGHFFLFLWIISLESAQSSTCGSTYSVIVCIVRTLFQSLVTPFVDVQNSSHFILGSVFSDEMHKFARTPVNLFIFWKSWNYDDFSKFIYRMCY